MGRDRGFVFNRSDREYLRCGSAEGFVQPQRPAELRSVSAFGVGEQSIHAERAVRRATI